MTAERRARRLLRWYPPSWRRRYGEEFVALLEDELAERPHSLGRGVDVARAGLAARAAAIGIGGEATGERRLQLDLALLAAVVTAFLLAGLSVWSQLDTGARRSWPHDAALRTAWWLTSGAVIVLAVIAGGLLGLLLWRIVRTVRGGAGRGLAAPLACALAGALVLCLGSRRFGAEYWLGAHTSAPGSAGLVPATVVRVVWAAGWWLNAYWAHPGALLHFTRDQAIWLVVNPLALAATLAGLMMTVRRLGPAPGLLRALTPAAAVAVTAMAVLLAGAGSWLSSAHVSAPVFRPGTVDFCELGLMLLAFLATVRLSGRAASAAWRR